MPKLLTRRSTRRRKSKGGAPKTEKKKGKSDLNALTRRLRKTTISGDFIARIKDINKEKRKHFRHVRVPLTDNTYTNELIKLVDEFVLNEVNMTNNIDEEYNNIIRHIRSASRRGDIHKLLEGLKDLSAYYNPEDPYMIPWAFLHDARIAASEMEEAKKAAVDSQLDELANLISKVSM